MTQDSNAELSPQTQSNLLQTYQTVTQSSKFKIIQSGTAKFAKIMSNGPISYDKINNFVNNWLINLNNGTNADLNYEIPLAKFDDALKKDGLTIQAAIKYRNHLFIHELEQSRPGLVTVAVPLLKYMNARGSVGKSRVAERLLLRNSPAAQQPHPKLQAIRAGRQAGTLGTSPAVLRLRQAVGKARRAQAEFLATLEALHESHPDAAAGLASARAEVAVRADALRAEWSSGALRAAAAADPAAVATAATVLRRGAALKAWARRIRNDLYIAFEAGNVLCRLHAEVSAWKAWIEMYETDGKRLSAERERLGNEQEWINISNAALARYRQVMIASLRQTLQAFLQAHPLPPPPPPGPSVPSGPVTFSIIASYSGPALPNSQPCP